MPRRAGMRRWRTGPQQPETGAGPPAETTPAPASGEPAGGGRRYVLRQRLATIGDDFWVQTVDGQRMFNVDGKALRLRHTLKFKDLSGRTWYEIQERALRLRDTVAIERDGRTVAEVRKALVSPVRQRFTVELAGVAAPPDAGHGWRATGDILQHEYRIEDDAGPVAEISRRWLRTRDTYTVDVAEGRDDLLVIAVAVAIDMMTDDR